MLKMLKNLCAWVRGRGCLLHSSLACVESGSFLAGATSDVIYRFIDAKIAALQRNAARNWPQNHEGNIHCIRRRFKVTPNDSARSLP